MGGNKTRVSENQQPNGEVLLELVLLVLYWIKFGVCSNRRRIQLFKKERSYKQGYV